MAPTKSTRASSNVVGGEAVGNMQVLARKGLQRRTANALENMEAMQTRGKRKAENSPIKNEKSKRPALGNLTNNVNKLIFAQDEDNFKKKAAATQLIRKDSVLSAVLQDGQNVAAPARPKVNTRAAARSQTQQQLQTQNEQATKMLAQLKVSSCHNAPKTHKACVVPSISLPADNAKAATTAQVNNNNNNQAHLAVPSKPTRRISNEFNKTEESLYMSALEDISSCETSRLSGNFEAARRRSLMLEKIKTEQLSNNATASSPSKNLHAKDFLDDLPKRSIPIDVEDFDLVNWNDPNQVSNYAYDIFEYLKTREKHFAIDDYMQRQVNLNTWMRSLLVDWMVEVQETFELNHETLYLAVKIVDLYLCKVIIKKEKLQLLGAAALFIACKFDERTPPLVEDFLYICDGAYQQSELIHMEMETLRTIDYDLGIPLSYRFLRRYSRCGKVPMPTLTLARYILELSLMDYTVVSLSDSQMAAAAMFMALRMKNEGGWSATMEHFSGYKLVDFAHIIPILNAYMHRKIKHPSTIKTIRSKYSHKIFHEVAKVPLMTNEQLLADYIKKDPIFKTILDESK